jgi:hypothetical protein
MRSVDVAREAAHDNARNVTEDDKPRNPSVGNERSYNGADREVP